MSKVKQVILAIAIAIILALFIGYGIATFYKEPKYRDFCPERERLPGETKEMCEDEGGKWIQPEIPDENLRLICYQNADEEEYICNPDQSIPTKGFCDLKERKCDTEYRDAIEPYNKFVFIITLVLGVIGLIIGGIVLNLESVSSGIMGGSILTIIYGTLRYWGDAPDVLRFIILGVVLIVLIWLGYRKIINPKKRK